MHQPLFISDSLFSLSGLSVTLDGQNIEDVSPLSQADHCMNVKAQVSPSTLTLTREPLESFCRMQGSPSSLLQVFMLSLRFLFYLSTWSDLWAQLSGSVSDLHFCQGRVRAKPCNIIPINVTSFWNLFFHPKYYHCIIARSQTIWKLVALKNWGVNKFDLISSENSKLKREYSMRLVLLINYWLLV